MQTGYNLAPAAAIPGMLRNESLANYILSYPAGEDIYPGRLCEVDGVTGLLKQVQDTGSAYLDRVAGIAIYQPAREQAYGSFGGAQYKVGEMVPVMRRGEIYAEWNGTTQAFLQPPNVNHSSTVATNRGIFTDASPSASSGSEISPVAGVLMLKSMTTPDALNGAGNVCLVEVNLPTGTGLTGVTGP